ncbi:MAG: MFS transporter [Candidatus Nanopelagicales bacterium]
MATERPVTGSVAAHASTEELNPRRWKILATLVVSLVVVVLDNTVLNVALKTIQEDLDATQSELIWAINAYTLVFAALLFTWGVLGDRFGRKRILIIGLSMFALASALCAFAASPNQLIFFRGLMGIGAASVLPVTLSIITVIFPPQERGRAIGFWAAAVGGAVALGPIVGGVLLEHPQWFSWLTGNDWGSVFFINVPIIAIGLVGIIWLVPETKNPNYAKLDPIGLVLSITGLLALVYGIQEAGWGKVSTYLWIGGGLLILIAFLLFERRTTHPSLDLSLFKIRSFSVPLAGVSLAFAALQGSLLFLAFYYQIVRGWSPLQSGLLTLPFAVGQLLAAPRSAKMVQRFGARRVIAFGVSCASVGMLLIATLPVDAPVWYLILTGFIFGFGLGNTIAPSTTRMTLATPPARSGSGSAVQNTVRQVAAALGVAIISSIVAVVYANNLTPKLEASALPADLQAVASDSIGSTFGVADKIDQLGTAPAGATAALRQAGIDAFMPSLHTAGFISFGLLLVALLIFVTRLPAKAEAVAWAGAPGGAPAGPADSGSVEGDGAPDAAHQVHVVDEHGDGLEHVEEAPLELVDGAADVAATAPEKG